MMRFRLKLSYVLVLSAASVPGSAQVALPIPIFGPSLSQGQLVTDIFLGRNVVGPYILSWAHIETGSEIVLRGALRLAPNLDYKLDPNTGSLIFMQPLKAREIVRVDFRSIPGKSTQNGAAAIQPIRCAPVSSRKRRARTCRSAKPWP